MNRNYIREDQEINQASQSRHAGAGHQRAPGPPLPAPRPITRLEAAHKQAFRALMRLRDLQSRTGLLADRLIGPPVNSGPKSGTSPANQEGDRPLLRQLEETSDYLHDAIDYITEALDRLELL